MFRLFLHCVHTASALVESEPPVKYHLRGCTSLYRLCLVVANTNSGSLFWETAEGRLNINEMFGLLTSLYIRCIFSRHLHCHINSPGERFHKGQSQASILVGPPDPSRCVNCEQT